ncbi:MAG TPA: methyltransferase domain-containing protein [Rhodanobacteraceae bacterium]|nr:methyltransferase domain-containing protein [Rhodanobacteraceae bacterium]
MAKPVVASLQRVESGVLARTLAGQAGAHGLYLSMNEPPSLDWPRVACLTRLRLADDRWRGDVLARVDEALPFADESFRMVVLEHVLEWTRHAVNLLDEAVRVLEPDGCLAVTGFHPFSPWTPWLLCRPRPRPMLTAPGWVGQCLAAHGFDTLQVRRCGASLPVAGARRDNAWLGGAFVLTARKQRTAIMSLKPIRRVRQESGKRHGAWVPGTQRECA